MLLISDSDSIQGVAQRYGRVLMAINFTDLLSTMLSAKKLAFNLFCHRATGLALPVDRPSLVGYLADGSFDPLVWTHKTKAAIGFGRRVKFNHIIDNELAHLHHLFWIIKRRCLSGIGL